MISASFYLHQRMEGRPWNAQNFVSNTVWTRFQHFHITACFQPSICILPDLQPVIEYNFVFLYRSDVNYNAVVEYRLFPLCWILWILTIRVHKITNATRTTYVHTHICPLREGINAPRFCFDRNMCVRLNVFDDISDALGTGFFIVCQGSQSARVCCKR